MHASHLTHHATDKSLAQRCATHSGLKWRLWQHADDGFGARDFECQFEAR